MRPILEWRGVLAVVVRHDSNLSDYRDTMQSFLPQYDKKIPVFSLFFSFFLFFFFTAHPRYIRLYLLAQGTFYSFRLGHSGK